ncbi:cytochrome c-552 [Striga asiatica]|uniref:Cytochrome c-552 n=1 Tax=Striga asiatica TaxID=4170 RepID=A0A5A7R784_STRAF|nr:cytochrome c-552 [Striga asiatica]
MAANKIGDWAFKAFTAGLGVATIYLAATFSVNVYRGLAWHSAQSRKVFNLHIEICYENRLMSLSLHVHMPNEKLFWLGIDYDTLSDVRQEVICSMLDLTGTIVKEYPLLDSDFDHSVESADNSPIKDFFCYDGFNAHMKAEQVGSTDEHKG